MRRNAITFDDDLWIVLNALSDKASSYRDLAEDIRTSIADGKAHSTYDRLAEIFDRQGDQAERIRDAFVAEETGRSIQAKAVFAWRSRLGVTQAKAGAKIGVSEKTIRDYEDGTTEPGVTELLAMAAVEQGLAPIV